MYTLYRRSILVSCCTFIATGHKGLITLKQTICSVFGAHLLMQKVLVPLLAGQNHNHGCCGKMRRLTVEVTRKNRRSKVPECTHETLTAAYSGERTQGFERCSLMHSQAPRITLIKGFAGSLVLSFAATKPDVPINRGFEIISSAYSKQLRNCASEENLRF